MSELPQLASGYAVFLACAAALLARGSRSAVRPWPESEMPRFRLVFARTLLVLAGFILVMAVIRAPLDRRAVAYFASAAFVAGVVAWRTRPR